MQVKDTQTGDAVQSIKVTCKDGTEKWRIKTGESYRYITQKEIDTYQIRKKMNLHQKKKYREETMLKPPYSR
ncbi:MAG: hypothetical protein IPL55_02740 [Saprospiraceae bacterium]|nr:hypothetical protein [Saprospiraceae bacterium]